MRRGAVRIIRALVFLLIFSYLFIHLTYAKRPVLGNSRDTISGFYAQKKDSIDMVLMGNSGGMAAYMPMQAFEQYGYASYNFCVNDMAIETYAFGLREILKTQHPKVILIDVRPFLTDGSMKAYVRDGAEEDIAFNTDAFRYSMNRFRFLWKCLPHTSSMLPYVFDLAIYHKEPLNPANWNSAYPVLGRGYSAFFDVMKVEDLDQPTDEIRSLDTYTSGVLDDLLKECRQAEKQTKILFFYLPYAHYDPNGDALVMLNTVRERVEMAGFDLFDTQQDIREIGLDITRDYVNPAHLNAYGAQKLTAWLASRLKERYALPDHRGEAAYQDWTSDLPAWHDQVAADEKQFDEAYASLK